eukprot:10210-Chlamydomonas_euryale.AAC.5
MQVAGMADVWMLSRRAPCQAGDGSAGASSGHKWQACCQFEGWFSRGIQQAQVASLLPWDLEVSEL